MTALSRARGQLDEYCNTLIARVNQDDPKRQKDMHHVRETRRGKCWRRKFTWSTSQKKHLRPWCVPQSLLSWLVVPEMSTWDRGDVMMWYELRGFWIGSKSLQYWVMHGYASTNLGLRLQREHVFHTGCQTNSKPAHVGPTVWTDPIWKCPGSQYHSLWIWTWMYD